MKNSAAPRGAAGKMQRVWLLMLLCTLFPIPPFVLLPSTVLPKSTGSLTHTGGGFFFVGCSLLILDSLLSINVLSLPFSLPVLKGDMRIGKETNQKQQPHPPFCCFSSSSAHTLLKRLEK